MKQSLLPVLKPDLQIAFYHKLKSINDQYLYQALSDTVKHLSIPNIDKQLADYVDHESIKKVASYGLRGELFFPVPCIMESNPKLLGYYRLLLGISQKEFYNKGPFGAFKRLEEQGIISEKIRPQIEPLCISLIGTAEIMIGEIDDLSLTTIRDLQILTLGPQLRGGLNTEFGKNATDKIFKLLKSLVSPSLKSETVRALIIENDSNRIVTIEFSSDPDISIIEKIGSTNRPLVSIEIKGGKDKSNIHNRIGEAEKSHQKAKGKNFFEFWTMLRVDLDYAHAKQESPTTTRFFNIDHIQDPNNEEYQLFRDLLSSLLSIQIQQKDNLR
ncbi:MAG: XcyI family restriction endonuclease [Methanothrix sp.]|nr:XcyI family restriction endonuclease [Methanothrix sp.]